MNKDIYAGLKKYIYRLDNGYFLGEKIQKLNIGLLDCQKPKRVFKIDVNNRCFALKINITSRWDARSRIKNEYEALNLIEKNKIHNVPRICYCNKQNKFQGREILIVSFIENEKSEKLSSLHIVKLVKFLLKLHSIKSRKFTIPYGKFNMLHKGNASDFASRYLANIKYGYTFLNRRYNSEILVSCKKYINFIENKFSENKKLFTQNNEFSLLHGHLTNKKNHRHILTHGGNISIIDWESACFGEREYELATFLYENYNLSQHQKGLFIKEYFNSAPFNKIKLKIYRFLIELDDLGEYLGKLSRNNKSDPLRNMLLGTFVTKQLLSLKIQARQW